MKPSTIDRLLDTTVVPGFTKVGYALRKRSFEPLTPMVGKTVVVSGATSGIGRASAQQFAQLGADVVILARNPKKAEQVEADLIEMGAASVTTEIGDLLLMADVKAVGERLLETQPRIDVLVNNAGVLFTSRDVTSEGIERTLALNLLGHFLLTNMLVPRLCESGSPEAPARIVNVTSGGMYTQRIRVRDLQWTRSSEWNGPAAYARTKRGQVILTEMWAAMLGPRVAVNSMHPGWADTPGVDGSLPLFSKIIGPIMRDPAQGADTIVWLASDPDAGAVSGEFWHDRKIRPTHRSKKTIEAPEDRQILWDALSELSGWSQAEWPDDLCG
jgi:NAD(P)-dependent dehydrogenase (short-subunit alcohol dehydrogenase family)